MGMELAHATAFCTAVCQLVVEILTDSITTKHVIDFDDQLYHPVVYELQLHNTSYKYIFVDEGQDLSRVQHQLVVNLAATNSRVCVVGDPLQAIYQFRGADENSMHQLQCTLSARQLHLHTSFRCSHAVTQLVRKLSPVFSCCEDTRVLLW